ncbi:MAG: hypothetical protein GQ538_07845 [Xanthomonadales bacterium]|nr:hypothetical protein [Xanthomonadales bacterium]
MNHLKNETSGAVAAAEPLFASVWLALFYEIRKNFIERRALKSAGSANSDPLKKK